MQSSSPNPSIGLALRALTFVECLALLAAGGGLFFLTEAAQAEWPWEVAPFNARFLGAIYLASLVAVGLMLYYGRWRPARLVLPMLFVFTGVILLVSLLYFGRFDFSQWSTWAWFALYLVLPLTAGYYLWQLRHWIPPAQYPTPPSWRSVLLLNALTMGLYGAGVFLVPEALTAFWPWPVDTFHARMYSAVFSTIAIGSVGLSQYAAPVERLTLGAILSTLGLFAIFGVIIVDATLNRVAWWQPGVYLWVALFLFEFLLGLALIWWSSAPREAE